MKKYFVIFLFSILFSVIHADEHAQTFGDALTQGDLSAKMRVFYFNRAFDEPDTPNAIALTGGGIIKYETQSYEDVKIALAYYGSHRIGGFYTREEGSGTSLLDREGEDLSLLGEAYVEYKRSKTMVKIGRQRLATPLIGDLDLRMLPSVYEAGIIRNNYLENTMIELGYLYRYTGFVSKENEFIDLNELWGKDGLAYLYVTDQSVPDLSIRLQYVKALSDYSDQGPEIILRDYRYIDASYDLELGEKSHIKVQYGGNDYVQEDDSVMIGAMAGTSFSRVDTAIFVNRVYNSPFSEVQESAMFCEGQQGYWNKEPGKSYGGMIDVHIFDTLSLKTRYMNAMADDGYYLDDFSELQFDLNYTINDYSRFRARFSSKDQTSRSSEADRTEGRLIYYIDL